MAWRKHSGVRAAGPAVAACRSCTAPPSGQCEVIACSSCLQAVRDGRLREVFGCGTACMVQPVERLLRASGEAFDAPFSAADPKALTARLMRTLGDIQYGRVAHEWSVPFE